MAQQDQPIFLLLTGVQTFALQRAAIAHFLPFSSLIDKQSTAAINNL